MERDVLIRLPMKRTLTLSKLLWMPSFLFLCARCGASPAPASVSPDGGKDGSTPADTGTVHADFFVSPAGSDTSGCGKLTSPCKTVRYTQPLVEALVKTNLDRTVSILLRGNAGPFWLTEPLSFGSPDSGSMTTPVVWGAYPGEAPILSGGVQVTGKWTSSSSAGGVLWTTSLPTTVVDFGPLFIDGKRHYTPRAPTTHSSGYLYNVGPVCLSEAAPHCKQADQPTVSRCPAATPYECYDRFRFAPGDISSSWKNLTVGAEHPIIVDDFEDWDVSKLRLASVDTTDPTNPIAYLTGPTAEENRSHGFLAGHRYVLENVEDYLTAQNGNFYVDESSSPWTLSYFTTAGDDPNSEMIVLPQQASLLTTSSPLQYVTFQGLTFSHDDWTVPAAGYISSQAEPLLPAAVSFVDASDVTIDSCIFTNIQGYALEFKGSGTKTGIGSNAVTNSAFYDIGGGGMRIGLATAPDYTDEYETGANTIRNNIVSGCGRIAPGAPEIFLGNSDNNTIEHNDISDGYADGFSGCVPAGNTQPGTKCPTYGNRISYNHVHDIKQGVTSDGGGIYLYSYNSTHVSTPNVIDHNWVHDVDGDPGPGGYGGDGIYLDSDSQNVTVDSNLVYRTSALTLFVNIGQGHTITNNIFAFGRIGTIGRGGSVGALGPLSTPAFTAKHNIFLWDQNIGIPTQFAPTDDFMQSPATWDCFSMGCTTQFAFESNLYWNATVGAAPRFVVAPSTTPGPVPFTASPPGPHDGSWQGQYGEDDGSAFADPHFTDPACGTDDYSLSSVTTATTVGFTSFDYKTAGRTAPAITPPPLEPAFPLQIPDDKCSFY
jgi:hypothetical protein